MAYREYAKNLAAAMVRLPQRDSISVTLVDSGCLSRLFPYKAETEE